MLDGEDYEARSAALLESYGFRIIARRYRCRVGEIDLIASDDHRLLFVEVRARRSRSHGGAAASVTRAKQCKLARCAALFLSRHPQWRHLPCRFDVIAWEGPSAGGAAVASPPRQADAVTSENPRAETTPGNSATTESGVPATARWIPAAFLL